MAHNQHTCRNCADNLRNRTATIDPAFRLPIVPAPGTGVVTESCVDRESRLPVAQHVGRMLRIGSEAQLCFECGPDGGVYHPACRSCDDECPPDCGGRYSMDEIRTRAEAIFLHDGDGSEPPTPAELKAFDAQMRRAYGLDGNSEPWA